MQKKKQNNTIKQIILIVIAVILLLLLIFAEDIIKLTNKNKLNLAQNSENELISNEPNPPQLSAGMIPVKWDGTNWIITTAKDKDWYDYSKGKPAYIMLNDGKYQSELIRDMTNKELAENNVGVGVSDDPNIRGTIFMWIPRFAEGENEEIGYLNYETMPSEYWGVPKMFSYIVADETKPNYYLSGIWVERDIDDECESTITEMNKEESIYGFIKNTIARKPFQFAYIGRYIDKLSELVVDENYPQINDTISANRIILQIVNTNKVEPIKAEIAHNAQEQKIEIQVTYTSNGIKEILDDDGTPMILTEENGIIYTDTGSVALGKGTYKFTVVDNKGSKKLLSITPTIDSLYKVAYINGTDNMDNTNTYAKTQETRTADENAVINQLYNRLDEIYPNSDIRYRRAIKNTDQNITVIEDLPRTEEDKQLYLYSKYDDSEYSVTSNYNSSVQYTSGPFYFYRYYTIDSSSGVVNFNNFFYGTSLSKGTSYYHTGTDIKHGSGTSSSSTFYRYDYNGITASGNYSFSRYICTLNGGKKFISYVETEGEKYTNGAYASDGYWYENGFLSPKYTLQKYDQNLTLQSTYDVDTKVLTTAPINISNKGNNKVKLTLNATGIDYKTYISSDNTNWQEVTDITSNTPKELNVDGWNNLYIKIETNTSRINNIDVAFYKD